MSRNIPVFLSIVAILFTLSCSQSFDSRAPFQRQLVIFSVLSTDRTAQFVRVETDYMPQEFDPLSSSADKSITNATVTITDGTSSYGLHDTTLPRLDTSRYKSPIHSFVLSPYIVLSGKSYRIAVVDPEGSSASASVTVPGKSFPGSGVSASLVIDNPQAYGSDADIIFNALLSATAKGFIGRLFVDYDVLIGSEWVEGRAEVPLAFVDPKIPDLRYVTYTQLTSRSGDRTVFVFKNALFKAVLQSVASGKFKSNKLMFNRVVFQLLQAEKNLFNYYNTTHAFRDVQSIRLDEPLFSNVSGGFGVVGAYTLDSLVHLLPEGFVYNNK